jgi:hypothetical protein
MPESSPQSFANHAKFDPAFHFVLVPLLLAGLIVTGFLLYREWNLLAAWILITQLALTIAGFKARLFALKVQDRVIRLEERLRLERILSESLRSRIGELSVDQLIGLRFASDAEVGGLVEKALANKWGRKEIKKAVQNWRPDYERV